jgi:hypothetical protein
VEAVDTGTYQELLRAVGAVLDGDNAGKITIVEAGDGFVVRRQRFRHTVVDQAVTHLTRETLGRQALKLREGRPASRVSRRPGLWSSFMHSHQDFLRSLGYELDSVSARQVVIDELYDGLLLSYLQPMAEGRTEVRSLALTKGDVELILNEAVRRRRTTDGTMSQQLGFEIRRPGTPPAEQRPTVWSPVRHRVPYQQELRAVGAILDEKHATRACVMEAGDGMVVRYQTRDGALQMVQLTDAELAADRSGHRHPSHLLRAQPGGYQDFFRALGYELERAYSSGVMISEGENGFSLTYEYLDPRQSLTPVKAMLFLGESEQRELLDRARARRRNQGSFLARLLLRQRRAEAARSPRQRATSGWEPLLRHTPLSP